MADDVVRTRLLQNVHDSQEGARQAVKDMQQLAPTESTLQGVWAQLKAYQPGDEPHKAVYVVGRCQMLLERWALSYKLVEEHNEARRKLEEYDRRRDIENG